VLQEESACWLFTHEARSDAVLWCSGRRRRSSQRVGGRAALPGYTLDTVLSAVEGCANFSSVLTVTTQGQGMVIALLYDGWKSGHQTIRPSSGLEHNFKCYTRCDLGLDLAAAWTRTCLVQARTQHSTEISEFCLSWDWHLKTQKPTLSQAHTHTPQHSAELELSDARHLHFHKHIRWKGGDTLAH